MLRAMTAEVSVTTAEPTPTAVVAATATWAEFPNMWGPMLDRAWSWEIYGDPDPSTGDFDVDVFWSLVAG